MSDQYVYGYRAQNTGRLGTSGLLSISIRSSNEAVEELEPDFTVCVCVSSFFPNRNITALQCWASFRCTTAWISRVYTCKPSLVSLLPHRHPTPLGHHRASTWGAELPELYGSFLLASNFTHGSVYMSMLLSTPPTLTFAHCVFYHLSSLKTKTITDDSTNFIS